MRSSVRSRLAPPDGRSSNEHHRNEDHRDLGFASLLSSGQRRWLVVRNLYSPALRNAQPGGFSDIVKRRSIRVRVLQSNLRGAVRVSPDRFRRMPVARPACCKTVFVGELDRTPSVRSYEAITGLFIQCPFARRVLRDGLQVHSAECVDIDNESNQVP